MVNRLRILPYQIRNPAGYLKIVTPHHPHSELAMTVDSDRR